MSTSVAESGGNVQGAVVDNAPKVVSQNGTNGEVPALGMLPPKGESGRRLASAP